VPGVIAARPGFEAVRAQASLAAGGIAVRPEVGVGLPRLGHNAQTGWGRISPWDGQPIRIVLDTAVAYAQYVLLTSLHR
jgi:hypothetical protein